MSDEYIQSAFNAICKQAKQAQGFYVSLMVKTSRYGGPEEGGWQIEDHLVVAYQHFDTEEQADAAREQVEKLAAELTADDKKAYGEHCLRSMEWLEARGLDADFLPEPNDPDVYSVVVSEGLPKNSFGCDHYE